MNYNGRGAAGSGKRELYTALALLVMVFVAAGALFAVPAWSQANGGKESEKQKRTQKSTARNADSAAKSARQKSSAREARNKGKDKGKGRGARIAAADDQYSEDDDLNGDGIVTQEEQLESAENDLDGETTDGETTDGEFTNGEFTDGELTNGDDFDTEDVDEVDEGVSATADENGAEAVTPGASARAGGDPDNQAPVRRPKGNVVDEIPASGPLPNTGGVPVVAGTVLALVLFGGGLLAVRLVMIWRERRA